MTGVILGALGAHKLKPQLIESGTLDVWTTAVQYQLVHAVAMLAVTLALMTSFAREPAQAALARWFKRATCAWAAGGVLFSGSLYWVALGGPRWLWPFAPTGGLCLIAGWGCVFIAACVKSTNTKKTASNQ